MERPAGLPGERNEPERGAGSGIPEHAAPERVGGRASVAELMSLANQKLTSPIHAVTRSSRI